MLINCSRNIFVTTQRKGAINRPARYFKLVTKWPSQSFLDNLQMKRKAYLMFSQWNQKDFSSIWNYLENNCKVNYGTNAKANSKPYNENVSQPNDKVKYSRRDSSEGLTKEEAEIDYTDSVLSSIHIAETILDLKEIETELMEMGLLRVQKERAGARKKETIIPFREYEFDGVKIYAGRNNLQNDRLLRMADPDDIWLHTQKYHSSHVIIALGGGQVRDELLLYAAEICAYYSDGRDGDKIPVDYCKRKYVKKPNKSKAGFVIYTDYKTILVKPNAPKE